MTETTSTDAVVEATAAAETPAADATTTEAKALDRDDAGRFKNPAQPRIDELTRARRESEREAAYWRTRAQQQEAQNSAPKAAPPKPQATDFADHDSYVEALAAFKADERIAEALKAEREERNKAESTKDRQRTWADRAAKTKSAYADFDTVLKDSEVSVTDEVRDSMADSELETDIAYHLARHPEIADRLNGLKGKALDREMGRIEDQLRAQAPAKADVEEKGGEVEVKEATPVRKTTSAPAPARPISSGRSTAPDLAKVSMDDYVKIRKQQGCLGAVTLTRI